MNRKLFMQAGATMIELVTSIVIFAIASAALTLIITDTTRRSADPMIQEQSNAIAEAYLEEIMLKSFCDPDLSTDCVAACAGAGACGNPACTSFEGAGNRNLFDDVCDYDTLTDIGALDQNGNPLGLDDYTVTVTVNDTAAATLGPGGTQLAGDQGEVVQIDITVTHTSLVDPVSITTYRANF